MKKEENTQLATVNEVPELIKNLTNQLERLENQGDDGISLEISYNGANIATVKKVSKLVEIGASVKGTSNAYNEYIKENNLDEVVVEWKHSGKNAEEWAQIIKKAITQIVNENQISILKSSISEMTDCLDAETKKKMKIQAILEKSKQKLD